MKKTILKAEKTNKTKHKTKTYNQYSLEVDDRIEEINKDTNLNNLQKLGKISKLNAERTAVKSGEDAKSTTYSKNKQKIYEKNVDQAHKIEIEGIKYGMKAAETARKAQDKLDSQAEKLAFKEWLDAKTSGPYDSTIANLFRDEADLLREWKEKRDGK